MPALQPCSITLCSTDSSSQEAICSPSILETSSISHSGVLPCMCRLVTMWAPPEYAWTFLKGGSEYQLDPAVEVFAFGVIMGQLLDCGLWSPGLSEDAYLQLLANGQYQMPVSMHSPSVCIFLTRICPLLTKMYEQADSLELQPQVNKLTSPEVPCVLLLNTCVAVQWQTPRHFVRQHEVSEPLKNVVNSCITYDPAQRPSMASVTKWLETILRTL